MNAPASRTRTLGEALVQTQVITAAELERARETQRERGGRLSEVLVSQGSVKEDELASFLSIVWHVPLIDFKTHTIPPEALALIPEELARKKTLIPLQVGGDSIVVVMADPDDYVTVNDIYTRTGLGVQVAYAAAGDIRRAIDVYYRATEQIREKVSALPPPAARESRSGFDIETPITASLDLLIQQAVRDRASDIHLEPQADRLRVRYRIDGILQEADSLPLRAHSELASRIKILAEMDVTRSRQPQDGQFSLSIGERQIDIRVATTDTIHGERITLRLLDKSLALFTLPELGFLPETLEKYRALLRYPHGVILVGGPTGSGKTTTLYTSLNEIDRARRNIMTIEDPVEYQFADISQSQTDAKAGVTFASGLRAMLRQDPDVILVGEIRDKETAVTAVQAAMTGHLVFSSIHANDAVGMITRLINLGVEPAMVSATLIAAVAQRMVRRICPNCKTAAAPSPAEKELYARETGQDLETVYKGIGCRLCANTGYRGRVGVFELLAVGEAMQQKLAGQAGAGELREQARRDGFYSMKRDGLLKVRNGITTFEEVMDGIFAVG